jgi:predicted TIM-barrel fold metal-dependent hydrolase
VPANERIPFVDSHVHLYDQRHPNLHYPWLQPDGEDIETDTIGSYGAIRSERYTADDFAAEIRFQNVERVVHVQASLGIPDPVDETRWLQTFNDRIGIPHAAIGYVDFTKPDAEEVLDRHLEFPIFRGVRDLRYDDYLTNPDWERGFRSFAKHGLVLCDRPLLEHVTDAASFAARFGEVTYCVDLALGPRQRDSEYFELWRRKLREIAEPDSTVIKIAGLGMGDRAWTVESLRPWVLACIEEFGVDRSFFGSNWPVDRLYSSYGDVLDAYLEIIAGYSESERRALFSDNAKRIFKL